MNREVHVRFWERPEVKVLRATRQSEKSRQRDGAAGVPSTADIFGDAGTAVECHNRTSHKPMSRAAGMLSGSCLLSEGDVL